MEIQIKDLQKKVRFGREFIRKAARSAISAEGMDKAPGTLNICLVGDAAIRGLNAKYHFRDRATDVLAFDISRTPEEFLADIIISAETARSNARDFRTSVDYELGLYAVHGVLHLAGYRDQTAAQRRKMQKRSDLILCRLFKRPKR